MSLDLILHCIDLYKNKENAERIQIIRSVFLFTEILWMLACYLKKRLIEIR